MNIEIIPSRELELYLPKGRVRTQWRLDLLRRWRQRGVGDWLCVESIPRKTLASYRGFVNSYMGLSTRTIRRGTTHVDLLIMPKLEDE